MPEKTVKKEENLQSGKIDENLLKFGMRNYDQQEFIPSFIEFFNALSTKLKLVPIDPIKQNQLLMEPMTESKMNYLIGKIKELQEALGTRGDGYWGAKSASAAEKYVKKFNINAKVPQKAVFINVINDEKVKEEYRINEEYIKFVEGEIMPARVTSLHDNEEEVRNVINDYKRKQGIAILTQAIGDPILLFQPYYLTFENGKEIKDYLVIRYEPYLPGKSAGIVFNGEMLKVNEFEELTGLNLEKEGEKIVFDEESLNRIKRVELLLAKYYKSTVLQDDVFHFFAGMESLKKIGYNEREAIIMLLRLNKVFGIRNFGRYSGRTLGEQYSNVDWRTGKLKIDESKKQMFIFSSLRDYNGAFLDNEKELIVPLRKSKKYRVFIFEVGNENTMKNYVKEINKIMGNKKYDVIIAGHGNEKSIALGESPNEESEFDISDYDLLGLFYNRVNTIILKACSTGKIETKADYSNLAKRVAETTGADAVIASPGVSYKINIRFDENNRINALFHIKGRQEPLAVVYKGKEGYLQYLQNGKIEKIPLSTQQL